MKTETFFKAVVTASVEGDGYMHLWGYNGKGKSLVEVGQTVLVKRWESHTKAHNDGGHEWPESHKMLYRIYAGHRNMFQLSEEKAKAALRAIRQGGKLAPVSEADLKKIAEDEEYFQYQMSR